MSEFGPALGADRKWLCDAKAAYSKDIETYLLGRDVAGHQLTELDLWQISANYDVI